MSNKNIFRLWCWVGLMTIIDLAVVHLLPWPVSLVLGLFAAYTAASAVAIDRGY